VTSSPASIRVLLVDDESGPRRIIADTLTDDSRFVVCGEAVAAEDAVRLARETQPHVIVLDQFLFGPVTGAQIVPDLRVAAPDARIVVLTASSHTVPLADGIVDAVLRKTDLDRLVGVVQALLPT
jgi:two-component system nitrate/nitrite response regulator NarL